MESTRAPLSHGEDGPGGSEPAVSSGCSGWEGRVRMIEATRSLHPITPAGRCRDERLVRRVAPRRRLHFGFFSLSRIRASTSANVRLLVGYFFHSLKSKCHHSSL